VSQRISSISPPPVSLFLTCFLLSLSARFALRSLDGIASAADMATWRALASAIVPSRSYAGWPRIGGNWAVVALAGEFLRYKMGLRPDVTDIEE
jgi:hypothetical protein